MNAQNSYQIYTEIELSETFTDVKTGEFVDPARVNLFIQKGDGSFLDDQPYYPSGGVTRDAEGHFSYDVTPDVEGDWEYQWQAVDDVRVVSPVKKFLVINSQFPLQAPT